MFLADTSLDKFIDKVDHLDEAEDNEELFKWRFFCRVGKSRNENSQGS